MNINLLPWREQQRQQRAKQFLINLTVALLMCVTSIATASRYIDRSIQQEKYLQQKLTIETEKIANRVAAAKTMVTTSQQLLTTLRRRYCFQRQEFLIRQTLSDVSNNLPNNLHMTKIQSKNQQLLIQGQANSQNGISALLKQTMKWHDLENPQLKEASKEGGKPIQFTLTLQQPTKSCAQGAF